MQVRRYRRQRLANFMSELHAHRAHPREIRHAGQFRLLLTQEQAALRRSVATAPSSNPVMESASMSNWSMAKSLASYPTNPVIAASISWTVTSANTNFWGASRQRYRHRAAS
jgi:hypothetical protein